MNVVYPPPPGQGWPKLIVNRDQVERDEPVAFRVEGSNATVMIPLDGLGLHEPATVVLALPGAMPDGTDLQVQIVVNQGSDHDIHAWASPLG